MASGSKSNKGNSNRNTQVRKKAVKSSPQENNFTTEIILLVCAAIAVILLISNFGIGGVVGSTISSFAFGVFGLMAFVFPIFLFLGIAFYISNRNNRLARKKMIAGVFFLIFFCAFLQLLTEGYMRSTEILEYFSNSAKYKTGGGIIGGLICKILCTAFGVAGAYVLVIMVLLICLILITQRSFFGFLQEIVSKIHGWINGSMEKYKENQPERDAKALEKAQRRADNRAAAVQRKQERLAAKQERLAARQEEENFLQDEFEDEDFLNEPADSEEKAPLDDHEFIERQENKRATRKFLEGTNLLAQMRMEKKKAAESVLSDDFEDDAMQDEPEIPIQRADTSGEASASSSVTLKGLDIDPFDEDEDDDLWMEEPALVRTGKNPKSSEKEIKSGIQNIKHEIDSQKTEKKAVYKFPPLSLLKSGGKNNKGDSNEHLRSTAKKLQDTLHNFGVNVTVTNVSCGPTVTRYELQPEQGVKVSKIVGLADDIKLNLATSDIRIEAPIPGKAAVGIEVPNKENSAVMLRDLLQSNAFKEAKSKLAFAAGKDIAGQPVITDIAKMPHLLIAGATGSGKSVCINTLIMSILYKAKPDEVKMIMIDPKVVELSVYNGIPHLFIPVVTDPKKAAGALNWAVAEMTDRYNTFAEYSVRNLEDYNHKIAEMHFDNEEDRPSPMPQIVIIVDELADLMMVAPGEVEDAICRLAQLARAAGIHLIIATQRPSVNVITGLIKANMPSRIAFSVSSGVDSRTILDMNGAEKLLGKGDMLFYPQGYQKPARLQGAYVSDQEVSDVVAFLSNRNPKSSYSEEIEKKISSSASAGSAFGGGEDRDAYFTDAGKFIIEKDKASIGMLQRMFKIGFNRAARIMDQLADAGVVGPEEGTKPRKVLMSMEQFENYLEES